MGDESSALSVQTPDRINIIEQFFLGHKGFSGLLYNNSDNTKSNTYYYCSSFLSDFHKASSSLYLSLVTSIVPQLN